MKKIIITISTFMFLCSGNFIYSTVTITNNLTRPIQFKYTYKYKDENFSPAIEIAEGETKTDRTDTEKCAWLSDQCPKTGYYVYFKADDGNWVEMYKKPENSLREDVKLEVNADEYGNLRIDRK